MPNWPANNCTELWRVNGDEVARERDDFHKKDKSVVRAARTGQGELHTKTPAHRDAFCRQNYPRATLRGWAAKREAKNAVTKRGMAASKSPGP